MMARNCREIRRRLSAFHDGELSIGEQIAVQDHLRECAACAVEVHDLDTLGAALRVGAAATAVRPELYDALPSIVVSRAKAEDAESISGWTGRLFEDLHLVWAALGATGATVACLLLIFTIFYYATTSPAGSNQNPLSVDARMNLPTAFSGDAFQSAVRTDDDEDAVFAMTAVVTREGRVAHLKLLDSDRGREAGARNRRNVVGLLDAMSKARFEPARYAGSPVPVAVNMVWLYASLTVRAKMPELQLQQRPPRMISSAVLENVVASAETLSA